MLLPVTRERRFEEQFGGPIFPFGAKDEYHPILAKDQARLHALQESALMHFFWAPLYMRREGWTRCRRRGIARK